MILLKFTKDVNYQQKKIIIFFLFNDFFLIIINYIFALFFVFVLNEETDDGSDSFEYSYTGKNKDECVNVKENEASEEKCNGISLDGDYNCCYLYGKDEDEEDKGCLPLKDDEQTILLAIAKEEYEEVII